MIHNNCNKYIQRALKGEEVFFKDISDADFPAFWDSFEINHKVVFNEDSSGFIKKKY